MMLTWCRLRTLKTLMIVQVRPYWARVRPMNEEPAHITVPQKMLDKIFKKKKKRDIEAAKTSRGRRPMRFKSPLVLQCKREEYNHHKGQSYSNFNPSLLASHGWKSKKAVGDHFTIMCHGSNPALHDKDDSRASFGDFQLDERILQSLEELGLKEPTKIQKLAIPRLLRGENLICAAETGSGKTYAYLLPLVNAILQQKQHQSEDSLKPNAPCSIIVAPARELVEQIMDVALKLTKDLPVRPHCLVGGHGAIKTVKNKGPGVDLLVCTPGILRRRIAAKHIIGSRLQSFVLDEADSLLDDSFNQEVGEILHRLQVVPSSRSEAGVQMALVSATLPRGLDEAIGETIALDTFKRVTTSHLHRLMPHVPQTFLRLSSQDKLGETVKLIKKNQRIHHPTMIFCNKNDTCYYLSKSLEELDIENIWMTGGMKDENRDGQFAKFQNGECDVLVCTDIASRGLDTIGVRHIVNYDFPLYMSDYIHRAGRVGRVGGSGTGHVTSFVTHKWDVDLLWNIEISARKTEELHNVNANIKKKLDIRALKRRGKKL